MRSSGSGLHKIGVGWSKLVLLIIKVSRLQLTKRNPSLMGTRQVTLESLVITQMYTQQKLGDQVSW